MFHFEELREPTWQHLTFSLLHFFWQGLLIAAAAAAMVTLLRMQKAQNRYLVYLVAMLAMVACPLVTFAILASPSRQIIVTRAVAGVDSQGQSYLDGPLQPGRLSSDLPTATPPLAEQSAAWLVAAQPYLVLGWFVGVLLFSVRLMLSAFRGQCLRHGRQPIPQELAARGVKLCARLGLRRLPRLLASAKLGQALVMGFLRPAVFLPLGWLTEMSPEMLEAYLAHELAHVRRGDLWVNLAQRLVETLLFYHPAVWWLSRRLRLEREMCCDELAVAALGNRVAYATALELAAGKRLGLSPPVIASAMAGGKRTVLMRVRNVLQLSPRAEASGWWPAGVLAVLVPLLLWLVSACNREPSVRMPPEKDVERVAPATGGPIRPYDLLDIWVTGTLIDQPIHDIYLVESTGQVALGPAYGRVQLQGLNIDEAQNAITEHLKSVLTDPVTQVVAAGHLAEATVPPGTPYRIKPGDRLTIKVAGTLIDQPIYDVYQIEPDGRVPLGPAYGRVQLKGLTFQEAEAAIEKHLKEVLKSPSVSVSNWPNNRAKLKRAQ